MGKINLLSKDISELIAAGEVIERPASIVKELLENSIDAGATAITVEIRNGGVSYIRVTDNGYGMVDEDIKLAFLRHATSKIKGQNDLNNISTLGFRGEALASISAVSRFEMISKTTDMQYGGKIMIEAGEMQDFDSVGAQDGTTIVVRDLFFNIPARLKFLKKDSSEATAINGIIDKLAIASPEISFKFISDGKIKLHTPGNGDMHFAVQCILGAEFAEALLPVSYEQNGIKVTGFIAKTQYSRSNRGMQHFFVNSRYVRSKTCMAALEESFKNYMMIGKYPSCVLNVEVPFASVDVNVHPAKIEVRFVNERTVFDVIYFAVKSALSSDDLLKSTTAKAGINGNPLATFKNEDAPQVVMQPTNTDVSSIGEPVKYDNFTADSFEKRISKAPPSVNYVSSPQASYVMNKEEETEFSYISQKSFIKAQPACEIAEQSEQPKSTFDTTALQTPNEDASSYPPDARIIGELFSTYLAIEMGEGLFLLDKHAAHERIIFERLKKTVSTDDRQLLLKPCVVALSADECKAVCDNLELTQKLGFSIEEFGNHSVIIREVPMLLLNSDIQAIVTDIANKIFESRREISSDSYDDLLHSMACRAAVKANDKSDISELTALFYEVYYNDEIRHCPHGRPVVISIEKSEIEKRFGRI